MTSLAWLTDAVLTSLELLAIVVGVAFIGLGGVKLVFSMVSLNLTIFLVLPNPTPNSELELLSSQWHFLPFLPDFFNAFLSFLFFLVSCMKLWFTGLPFLPPFLAARKSDFSFPSFFLNLHTHVCCAWYTRPHTSCTGCNASQSKPSWAL
jgi:hypothetical protein